MRTSEPRKTMRRINSSKVILWIGVLVSVVIWMIPFVFIVFTSLKTQAEVLTTPSFAPPGGLAWENYAEALRRGDLLARGLNSASVAVIKVPAGLLVSALGAFAIARLKLPYPRVLLGLFVFGTMIPVQVAIASLFRIVLGLGLLNTKLGLTLPYIAFGVPYEVFMLYGFFQTIPHEMDEAARIDGASSLQIFWRIILPLSKPALAAVFVLDFVATWNEYAMALVILMRQESWTIPLALQGFNTQYTSMYGPLNAAIIMSILPVLIVYFLFQRYFVEGLYAGAIKG